MAKEFRGVEALRPPRTPSSAAAVPADTEPARRGIAVGVFSLVIAATAVVLLVIGATTAMGGDFVVGTALGYSAAAASFLAVLFGLFAAISRRGRWLGIAAMITGFIANPFIITAALGWASTWVPA